MQRTESTTVVWENETTPSGNRFVATARHENAIVDVQAQTIETSIAFPITREALREFASFLVAIADDLDTWEDDTEQPHSAASDDEGTVE